MTVSYDVSRLAPPQNVPDQVRLTMREGGRTYMPTEASRQLLEEIGGVETLKKITKTFYGRVFKNAHLELFFERTDVELHSSRLANWVAEKMGGEAFPLAELSSPERAVPQDLVSTIMHEEPQGTRQPDVENEDCCIDAGACDVVKPRGVTSGIKDCPIWAKRHPWTYEREIHRDLTGQQINYRTDSGRLIPKEMVVHDRSSAHFAAWHSVKRSDEDAGLHFGLVDSRVWMRLHFWACRTVGVFVNSSEEISTIDNDGSIPSVEVSDDTKVRFQDWYTRFLGHFVRIYERDAPEFALESAEWSNHVDNLQTYLTNGQKMDDVLGKDNLPSALRGLPAPVKQSLHSVSEVGWPYKY